MWSSQRLRVLAFTPPAKGQQWGGMHTPPRGQRPKTVEKGVKDRMSLPCNGKSVAPGCVMQ